MTRYPAHGVPAFARDDRRRAWMVGISLTLGLVVLALADLSSGRFGTTPTEVLRAVFGSPNPDPRVDFIVMTLRLPRLLVAVMAGAALAVSGLLLQALTRNALAAPGLIGINAGAAAAVLTGVLAIPSLPLSAYPFAALAGGLATAGAVFLLAWNDGPSPLRFLLIGIGASALCAAVTSTLVTFAAPDDAQAALAWLVGSLHGRSWPQVATIAPWLAVLLASAALLTRALDATVLGRDTAAAVGVATGRLSCLTLLIAAGLAAAAVATVGALGFVGLIAPHMARALVGPRHGALLPVTALTGAALVLMADMVGRVVFAPVQLPAGIVTAIIGVPYFLWLLLRGRSF